MSDAPQGGVRLQEPDPGANVSRGTHLPGDGAMWFFVLGDMIIFGLYFLAFMIFRDREVDEFTAAQQDLYLDIGVVNTLLLLFSSWLAARAVLAVRAGDTERTVRLLTATGACGAVFIVMKLFEWWLEVDAGHTFPSNTFMSFYFVLTGVHMLHVIMGLIILTVVVGVMRKNSGPRVGVIEQATTYWHMVDLLWVIIFALLYVLR